MMLRSIFGATLITTFVALVAAFTVVSIGLLMAATSTLTQTSIDVDDLYFAEMADDCNQLQASMCR